MSFLITPSPTTTSLLFPYTTLFRSVEVGDVAHQSVRLQRACDLHLDGLLRGACTSADHERHCSREQRNCKQEHPLRDEGRIDRKSTRLNSSHRCISYAVFCLKKKKK